MIYNVISVTISQNSTSPVGSWPYSCRKAEAAENAVSSDTMKKTDDNIIQNEDTEVVVGEVISQEEASAKTRAQLRQDSTKPPFGSYITKSNELIQKTKYSLPRNEQKILFM